MTKAGEVLGHQSASGRVMGTYVHGLFQTGAFRQQFLDQLNTASSAEDFHARIDVALDALADALEKHLDLDALYAASR